MNLLIDKHGGLHYHKLDCQVPNGISRGILKPIKFNYKEIDYPLKRKEDILVDGKYYNPCPFCFGHMKFRTTKENK